MDNEPNERDKREFDVRCPECRCEFCAADQLVIPRPPGDREAAESKRRAEQEAYDLSYTAANLIGAITPDWNKMIAAREMEDVEAGGHLELEAWGNIKAILAAALTAARAEERENAKHFKRMYEDADAEIKELRARVKELEAAGVEVTKQRRNHALILERYDEDRDFIAALNSLAALLAKGARESERGN